MKDFFRGCQFEFDRSAEKFFQHLNFQLGSRLGVANFSGLADIYSLVRELLKYWLKNETASTYRL